MRFWMLLSLALTMVLLSGRDFSRAQDRTEDQIQKIVSKIEAKPKDRFDIANEKKIADVKGLMDKASEMQLYRLDPKASENTKDKKTHYHGYPILNKVYLEKAEDKKAVLGFVVLSLHYSPLLRSTCFRPTMARKHKLFDKLVGPVAKEEKKE